MSQNKMVTTRRSPTIPSPLRIESSFLTSSRGMYLLSVDSGSACCVDTGGGSLSEEATAAGCLIGAG